MPELAGAPASTLAPDPPGRWRALALLAAAVLLAMAPWFSTAAVLPQLELEWSLSTAAGAWLTMAVQLGFVAGALASALANLADVLAPRRLIVCGSFGAAAANAALIACHGPAPALAWRAVTGACLALVYPPALKHMATWFRRGRGTALGILVGALTAGSALPHLVNAAGGLDWRRGMALTSLLAAGGGLLVLVGAGEGPFPFPRARFEPRELALAARNRGVRLSSLGYFGHMWELYAMWSWIGAFFADRFAAAGLAAPRTAASLATFAAIGVGALGCWYGGRLGDRYGRPWATIAAMTVSGACALTLGWLPASPLLLFAVALVWGVAVVADSAQFSALVTEAADPAYVGTALTAQLGLGFTLTLATIWLLPLVRAHGGWGPAFSLLALGPACGIAAMRRLRA